MEPKYKMSLSLNVLNHLGLNLYSNIPAVLSEIVANAYDADATLVTINLADDKITIKDNGIGMTNADINDKFLYVGYQKRENGEDFSSVLNRPVMGRKGIGKLSLFSIADTIEIFSTKGSEVNGFRMNKDDIQKQIKENGGTYYPSEIEPIPLEKGTVIVLSNLKKEINKTENFLKRRLARRFSVIGSDHNFEVKINNSPITIGDREFLRNVEFLWTIGEYPTNSFQEFNNIKEKRVLNGELKINDAAYKISGWIGTVEAPSQLKEEGTSNNKISIICRGKMAQEDILDSYTEGGIYADYIVGEVTADFLDDTDYDDIATSSRQNINEADERFIAVRKKVYEYIKKIQTEWSELRNREATTKILKEFPVVEQWYENINQDYHKEQARKLFKTIDRLHFDKDNKDEKRTLVRQAVLAFEQLKVRDNLNKIDKITSSNELELASVFTQLSEIEAMLYYDIAHGRVGIIRELKGKIDKNELEAVLQRLLFDNIWLLNPAWERATRATEFMEKRVSSLFETETLSLTEDERKGRIDIGYRTSGGKHIIVELKRYDPSYKIDPFTLAKQVSKYYKALKKCLEEREINNPYIECICIIGKHDSSYTSQDFNNQLAPYNARIYKYDQLIDESLHSYDEYLKREEIVGNLKRILDQI